MELEVDRDESTSTLPKWYANNIMDDVPERARMGIVLNTDNEPAKSPLYWGKSKQILHKSGTSWERWSRLSRMM